MRRYGTFTPARRAALRRASQISAQKRRRLSPRTRKAVAYTAIGLGTVGVGAAAYQRSTKTTLYHNTSAVNAAKIKQQGFKGRKPASYYSNTSGSDFHHVYFSNKRRGITNKFGDTKLKVRVKKSVVKPGWHNPPKKYKEQWPIVHEKDLHGVKVKQVKNKGLTRRQKKLVAAHQRRRAMME
jgi:hypothetical protein